MGINYRLGIFHRSKDEKIRLLKYVRYCQNQYLSPSHYIGFINI